MHGHPTPPTPRPGLRNGAAPWAFAALALAAPLHHATAQPSAPPATPAGAAVSAPAPAPDLNDPHRWSETAYGISLRPPNGWTAISAPRDGNDFTWQASGAGRLAFKIAYSKIPVQLDQASVQALVQMGFALDNPRLRRNAEQRRIGDRPATVMLFDIDSPEEGEPWFYAHAVVMLEPYAAAVIKVQSSKPNADAALAHFETVLDSLHVPLGVELEALRRPQIDRGQAWLNTLPPGTLEAAVPHDRWYRLSIDGHDIGHRRVVRISDPVSLSRDPELRRRGFTPPGTAVVVQDHRQRGNVALDRSLYLYAEAANEIEIWDLKQTLRPATAPHRSTGLPSRVNHDQDAGAVTWVETGTRGPRARRGTTAHNVIEIVQEIPPASAIVAGVKAQESHLGTAGPTALRDHTGQVGAAIDGRTNTLRWQTPSTAYLGQIQAMGLPAAMPREPGTAFAFYAWDPASEALALRTVRVGADPDGQPGDYIVYERPASSISESRHRFTAQGIHLETLIPGGLTLTPTTAQALGTLATKP